MDQPPELNERDSHEEEEDSSEYHEINDGEYDSEEDHDYDSEEDSDGDVGHEFDSSFDDFDETPAAAANTDRVPLVPIKISSLPEALQNFIAGFESRYGLDHPFSPFSSLQECFNQAFGAPGQPAINERKPVAIYLHNDNSVASNIFAQQVMCSGTISPLLKNQFVTFGWDVTFKENYARFIGWLELLNLNQVSHYIRHIRRERFPVLMVLIKDRADVLPIVCANGHDAPDVVLNKLMPGLDAFISVKNRALQEERARKEREELRALQVAEYEESKKRDKAKQEERERAARQAREEEEARVREEQAAARKREKLKQSLPSEPDAAEKNIITIRLRFPTGDQQIRRFRMDEQVKWLVTYCESLGYDMNVYRLFTSDVPKKDVATLDNQKTFCELKWPPREQITIDEK